MDKIQLTNDKRQRFRLIVGGQDVAVFLYLNTVDNHWYMDLFDFQGNEISLGKRIVDREFVLNFRKQGFLGNFYLMCDAAQTLNEPIDLVNCRFYYLTEREVVEALNFGT